MAAVMAHISSAGASTGPATPRRRPGSAGPASAGRDGVAAARGPLSRTASFRSLAPGSRVQAEATSSSAPISPSKRDKVFVIGNLASHGTTETVQNLMDTLQQSRIDPGVEAVIAPPAPFMHLAKSKLSGSAIELAAQNICIGRGERRAGSGEVSADMLLDMGVPWVIAGHSDRRTAGLESNARVADKVAHALDKGLRVVACVGENADQRNAGHAVDILDAQLHAIADAVQDNWDDMVIAYEPVWAAETSVPCTPGEADRACEYIRAWLGPNADRARIIYGGDVTSSSAGAFTAQTNVDGLLVGGESPVVDPLGFAEICNTAAAASTRAARQAAGAEARSQRGTATVDPLALWCSAAQALDVIDRN